MQKKTVFLTGSSGNMGFQGFKELYARRHMYNIVLLNLDDAKARKKFQPYENDPCVKLVWGNLMNYDDVLECVTGADYVLHVGGMVSPAADYFPKKTFQVNCGAMKNIVQAVKAQPDPDKIKVVYIGTVAEYGDRNPPTHWGRTGDPIQISVYDHYAISKTIAESILAESGLKYWVSLRQSGILYPAIINNLDPIMFHVPINGVLEWATVEDSGRLLAKVCNPDVPEEFWRNFYNISSGKEYRLTNFEFEALLLEAVGLGKNNVVRRIFDANWFILQNFHGVFYTDADKLEDYLHFRANIPVKEYFKGLSKNTPPYFKLAILAPKGLVKSMGMKKMANTHKFGTQTWVSNDMKDRITAYYGSMEKYRAIGTWKDFDVVTPGKEKEDYTYLDHGYDES
ncbi:MAG: NAD(P)-dependent oxidoreductase, partial [Clostridia bacterium]|nr:NAD(P)-dependent oxidoreductase [Clostridia bacterium]